MNAPLSKRIRCLFSGHDWRTAIGPRSGYYERCRRCFAMRDIPEDSEIPAAAREDMQRSGRSGVEPSQPPPREQQSDSDERVA